MVRMRFSRVLVAVVLVAVAAGTGPAVATASPAAPRSVSWTPCADGFQCSTFAVPLDHANPSGQRITLRLVRLPAGDPAHRIGSLFVNPGGPGASGIDLARAIAPILPLELRGRFDIVGFDPRGILGSTPLRCFPTIDDAFAVLPPWAFPYTPAEEEAQKTLDSRLGAACSTAGGAIRDHMSTADVARDMDLMRAALGDSALSYLGFSYGTYIGATYANMFPDRVRAIVVDGVLNPVAWSTGAGGEGSTVPVTTRLRSDVGAQATLDEFFRLCDAAGPACAFAPQSAQRYAALVARARQAPLVIGTPPDSYTVSYADIVGVTLGSLYSPYTWPDLAAALAQVETQAAPTGGSAAPVRAAVERLGHKLGFDRVRTAQEEYPNYVEGFPSVLCSDSVNPTTFAAWPEAAAAAERQHGYFGRIWTWMSSPCLPWPSSAGQNRYLGPWTATTAAPVLVVGNYYDPATAYQGAVTLANLLPNSRLLSYSGWGHTAFFGAGSYCVDAAVTHYLVSGETPPAGTVCDPTSDPFEGYGPMGVQRAQAFARIGLPMLPPGVRQAFRTR
jgi:pimeloyl-ACP methyl ester carboxylesterase